MKKIKNSHQPISYHLVMDLDFALNAAKCRRNHPWHTGHLHSGAPNVKIREVLGVQHLSFDEIIKELQKLKDEGFKVIPSEGCDYNPDGTCTGHVKRGVKAATIHA